MKAIPQSSSLAYKQPRRAVVPYSAKGFGAPSSAPPKQSNTVKPAKDVKATAPKKLCPCGSGQKYQQCCEVYHRGDAPPTAEATLRARFSAYVLGQEGFLLKTFHPDYHSFQYGTEKGGAQAKLQQDVTTSCTKFTYSALDVKKVNQENDQEAFIEFTYRKHEKAPDDPRFKPQAFVPKWLRNQKSQLQQTVVATPDAAAASQGDIPAATDAAATPAPAAAVAEAPTPASPAAAAAAPAPNNKVGVLMAECSKWVLHEGSWKFAEYTVMEVDDSMLNSMVAKAEGAAAPV